MTEIAPTTIKTFGWGPDQIVVQASYENLENQVEYIVESSFDGNTYQKSGTHIGNGPVGGTHKHSMPLAYAVLSPWSRLMKP